MRLSYFHAPWCGVCHLKAPVAHDIAREAGLPLDVWDIEEPAGAAEAERRRIRQVPTLALVIDERVPFRLVGAMITPTVVNGMLERFIEGNS